jgi:NADH-quinone oxidoreductase subunit J
MFDILFYLFAGISVLAALVVVTSRNMARSAFALLFAFSGVAAVYVLLAADFIAVAQLLIYVGGILVLLAFGVMLTSGAWNLEPKPGNIRALVPVVIVAALAGTLMGTLWQTQWPNAGAVQNIPTTVHTLGVLFLTDYLLPFEISSVVLLVALVGAAMIARQGLQKV